MKYLSTLYLLFIVACLHGQGIELEGYAFEKDNRGFLNQVRVTLFNDSGAAQQQVDSNEDGFFAFMVPAGFSGYVTAQKDLFYEVQMPVNTSGKQLGDKVYLKVEMERKPGYIFDVTIAPARDSSGQVVDAIRGSWVEIYNNTTEETVYSLKDYQEPNFQYTFEKGNHYTVMVRAKGYFTKRMEAFVDVKGCILCFEGIGDVRPAVTDNLTQGNEMGTLLANIELFPANIGDKLTINDIYYEYNKWSITDQSAIQLDEIIEVLRDNPAIILELGSHTDSRGDDDYNYELSGKRASSAVEYLISQGIESRRIVARGYGESSLVNDCTDDVECTEDEHAQNRRTELKVIGFLREDPLADKTLQEIKEEEQYNALLKEIQSGGQVRGDQLPEDVKKQLEGESQKPLDSTTSAPATDPMKEEVVETMPEKPVVEVLPNEVVENVTVVTESVKDVEMPLIALADDFSGVKIQILASSTLIDATNPLVQQYGTVYYTQTAQRYVYMVGNFTDRDEARSYLDNTVKPNHPDAFLVTYVQGVRQ